MASCNSWQYLATILAKIFPRSWQDLAKILLRYPCRVDPGSFCCRFDDRPKMTSCIPITSFTFTGGSSLEGIICMSMDRQNFFNFPDSYKVSYLRNKPVETFKSYWCTITCNATPEKQHNSSESAHVGACLSF